MAAPFDLLEEAKRLIRLNTVTWSSNADCAVYVGSLFRQLGLEVVYQEDRSHGVIFLNVAGLLGLGKNPVLLTTHLDTVDPGDPRLWKKTGRDPWRLAIRDNHLYGLGVADTKLDLLCKCLAVAQVKRSALKKPILILGTFGEESGLRGAARFCQGDLPKPQMALVGEPTDLSLVTRHKGFAVVEILWKAKGLHRPSSSEWVYTATFTGQASHSSTPDLGRNAVMESLQFLQSLRERHGKLVVLSWEGGTGQNIIPPSATIRFSLGEAPKAAFGRKSTLEVRAQRLQPGWYPTFPWEKVLWCVETMGKLFAAHEKVKDGAFEPPSLTWNVTLLRQTKEGWGLAFDIRALPGQSIGRVIKNLEEKLWKQFGHPGPTWQFHLERDNPSLDMEKQAPVVKCATSALRAARLPVRLAAKAGCSEAGLYARVGIPSVVFGPGRSAGNIHRPNEMVNLQQLKKAIRFYELFLRRTCF